MINRRFWIYLLIAIVLVASVALLGVSLLRLRQSNQTIASLRSVNSNLQERLTAQGASPGPGRACFPLKPWRAELAGEGRAQAQRT